MRTLRTRPRPRRLLPEAILLATLLLAAACGSDDSAADDPPSDRGTLRIGAIPDQDPEILARNFGLVADYLSAALDVDVEFVPVVDYPAAVTLFSAGDLDLVWFGGLTGVQARLETPGAEVIAERDIDQTFRSVFIANAASGIEPVDDVEALDVVAGRRFTFGSESSTSGRLMPQYFLAQAGVTDESFAGAPGFSGSHDKTIELVEAGTFEAGVLNEQVWLARLEDGSVDEAKVEVIFQSPTYHDYHWILQPDAAARLGDGFADKVRRALTELSTDDPEEAAILELFGAEAFVPASPDNYTEIEQIGRDLGLITG
ncbi:MAG: putative selenate ABC transporter substrate-binding protein [Acidimicrobiales bacterium]